MQRQQGMVLVIALIFLLVMSLLVFASLLAGQLSVKTASAGQQQLQVSQQAMQEHLTALSALTTNAEPLPGHVLSQCPAQYAAWSDSELQCEVLQLQTQSLSANQQFASSYTSLVLKQRLISANGD